MYEGTRGSVANPDIAKILRGDHVTDAASRLGRTFVALGGLELSRLSEPAMEEASKFIGQPFGDLSDEEATELALVTLGELPPYALAPTVGNVIMLGVKNRSYVDPVFDVATRVRGSSNGWNTPPYMIEELQDRYIASNNLARRAGSARSDIRALSGIVDDFIAPRTRAREEEARQVLLKKGEDVAATLEDSDLPTARQDLEQARGQTAATSDLLLWAARQDRPHTLRLLAALWNANEQGCVLPGASRIFPDGLLRRRINTVQSTITTTLRKLNGEPVNSDPFVVYAAACQYLGLIPVAQQCYYDQL